MYRCEKSYCTGEKKKKNTGSVLYTAPHENSKVDGSENNTREMKLFIRLLRTATLLLDAQKLLDEYLLDARLLLLENKYVYSSEL